MNANLSKLLRTAQVEFPSLLETKFRAMRLVRNTLKVPFEYDFRALSLFPEVEGAVYLDVGANRGQSTDAILMARKNATIHQFEPNDVLVEKLRDTFGGDERIVIHDFGLGDETTQAALVVPYYKKWMFDGLGSFNPDDAASWLKDKVFFFSERALTLHESRCQIRTLDELGLAPFFMKVDVQGYEFRALKGGDQTLRAHEPVLLIESPDSGTVRYLNDLGYDPFAFEGGSFIRGRTGRPNTFFMTDQKASLVTDHITDGQRQAA
jgi:FkbM family methyltransferase